ncbi:MAG: ABC transporter ATP-binding protein [Nanobdellota archaeon]
MKLPVFRIENITKAFGKHIVLKDLSINIYKGEIIGIAGASGAGKTTFLNTLIGFLKPEEGSVLYYQDKVLSTEKTEQYQPVIKKLRTVKQLYGFASQTPSFYGELTTVENLRFFGSLHGLDKKTIHSNTRTLLRLMELNDARDIRAKRLSGGMERRLDIACALMHDPEVLILDEPTADLDPLLRDHIWELIKKINKKGTTIILSSHHLGELELLCDRVAFLKNKHFEKIGTPETLKKEFDIEQEIIIQTAKKEYSELIKKLKHKHITSVNKHENNLIILTRKPEKVLKFILTVITKQKQKLEFVDIVNPSLDDIFVKMWSRGEK